MDLDVAVIGTDVTAGMLAASLARRGLGVAVVAGADLPAPPRVDATIPFSSAVLQLLAARERVPQIGYLADAREVARHVGPGSGAQRVIGFVAHRPGAAQRPEDCLQLTVPREHAESHLLRPEVDAHLLRAAAGLGADVRADDRATEVTLDAGGATIRTAAGTTLRARCVVETSRRGPLGAAVGGSAEDVAPPPTRSIEVTLVGVRDYDVTPPRRGLPWSTGSLHHVVAEGWLGVAGHGPPGPQRTHRVALHLDTAAAPDLAELPAADVFAAVLARYPSIGAQLGEGRPMSAWLDEPVGTVGTPAAATPTAMTSTAGDRWCLAGEAAASEDPLFGRPMVAATEQVLRLAPLLAQACADDDLSAGRLGELAAFQAATAAHHSALVATARRASGHFPLFSAVVRVWLLGSIIGALTVDQRRKRFARGGDESVLADLGASPVHGAWYPVPAGYHDLVDATFAAVDAVAAGTRSAEQAAAEIYARLGAEPFVPPIFGFADPEDRCYRLSVARQIRTLVWLARTAPPDVKALAAR